MTPTSLYIFLVCAILSILLIIYKKSIRLKIESLLATLDAALETDEVKQKPVKRSVKPNYRSYTGFISKIMTSLVAGVVGFTILNEISKTAANLPELTTVAEVIPVFKGLLMIILLIPIVIEWLGTRDYV